MPLVNSRHASTPGFGLGTLPQSVFEQTRPERIAELKAKLERAVVGSVQFANIQAAIRAEETTEVAHILNT